MLSRILVAAALMTVAVIGPALEAEAAVGGDAVSVVCPIDRVSPVQVLNYVWAGQQSESISAWYRFENVHTREVLDSGWITSTVAAGRTLPKASFFVPPGSYRVHVWYYTATSGVVGVPSVHYRTSGFGPTSNCFVP